MKLSQTLLFLLAFVTTIHALALPASLETVADSARTLFKRRGGGGGRGGGFHASSGSPKGSSGSGSARTARLGSSTSNTGGKTPTGTGQQPRSYPGGNAFYYGGSRAPYRAGSVSRGGITPRFLPVAALGFFPGIWLYGAYAYGYPHSYTYHNDTSGQNETKPVECLCGQYQECGCDQVQDNNTQYINSVANNGTQSRLANVNGSETLVINGTLQNGTTVASAAPSFKHGLTEMSGWWVVIAGVVYTAWFF